MIGIYATETFLQVMFVTGMIGGGAAWASGRAIAETWRPFRQVVLYIFMLGAAVRFAHFALFQGELLSIASYLADTLYLLAVGGLAWRLTRTRRMVTQYRWLYERSSPLTWRERSESAKNHQNG
jgi:hypothetical protein